MATLNYLESFELNIFNDNEISPLQFKELLNTLSVSKKLRSVNLAMNSIGFNDDCMLCIAILIKRNPFLRELLLNLKPKTG